VAPPEARRRTPSHAGLHGALLAALTWLSTSAWADARVTEIIELEHALLDDVVPMLRELVSPGGTVTGMHDQLVIRTTPSNLADLRKVLARLDRAPRRLRISVRQDSGNAYRWREDELAARIDAGDASAGIGTPRGGPGARVELSGESGAVRYRSYATEGLEDTARAHFVTALEGRPAWIGTGQDVPLANRQLQLTPWGAAAFDSIEYTHVGSGFYVTPRLGGDDQVTLDIAPYADARAHDRGATIARRGLTTTVRGRLGEWLPLGGGGETHDDGTRGIVHRTRDAGSQHYDVWVKVDLTE